MKHLIATIILFCAFTANAQSDKEYFDLVKQAAKIEAKEFIYTGLNLGEQEIKLFDPVFNSYFKEESKVAVAKMILFEQYANNLPTYSEEQINSLNKEVLNYDLKRSKINQKYYKKFVKAIGVKKATTFFFLKKYLDNLAEGAKLEFLAR